MTDIKHKKISDYTGDTANANKGNERGRALVKKSFEDYGAGRSVLADKHGVLIAGNKTAEGARAAGIENVIEVETDGKTLVVVRRTDLDLNEGGAARELAYVDNRAGEIGLTWDAEQIAADVEAGLLPDGYFGEDELAEILAGIEDAITPADDPGAQVDKADELLEKWKVERGDLWVIPSKTGKGEHRILCGDSTDAGDVARVMGGLKLRLFVSDPPYGVSYGDKNKFLNAVAFGNRVQTPISGDHLNAVDIKALWLAAFKTAFDASDAGCPYYITAPQGGDHMMMMMMIGDAGWLVQHELIWLKNNHVLGRSDYQYKHEPILYGWKPGSHWFYGDRSQFSVWEIPKPQNSDMHPTMKPVELFVRAIENSSRKDEMVGDWFSGSGTTLVACEQTGRLGRGIEIEPKYVAVTLERLSMMGLVPIRDSAGGSRTAPTDDGG